MSSSTRDGSATTAGSVAESRGSGIQVIARAADILRALKASPGGLTQAEVAERLGLPRTTISRILSALEDEEMVAGNGPRGRFRVGPEISRLAAAANRELVGLVHPMLVELSTELAETVDLSVLDGNRVTFIDQVDAPHRLRAASAVGESFPLYSCAPGKALLALQPSARLAELLPAVLTPLTEHTITSPKRLREQLARVRQTQVAYDYEEQNAGICAAGIAVDVAGATLAVSIPMPAQRFAGREDESARALIAFRQRLRAASWA